MAFRSVFTGLSLNETIRQLLFRNMSKKAEKLRSDFKCQIGGIGTSGWTRWCRARIGTGCGRSVSDP